MYVKIALCLLCLSISFWIYGQPSSWESRGIGGGGALYAPAISPHNNDEIYLQCDMTEVFHSTNFGQTWSEVSYNQMISTGGPHPVEFTSNPDVLYTVNVDYTTGYWMPAKSNDAGQTWTGITDPTYGEAYFISADPYHSDRLLLSSYTELFMSSDGGATFTSVYDHGSDFYISGVLWDSTNIYVGSQIGLLVSTDNGSTFALDNSSGIPSNEGFLDFTGSKENGIIRLMGTTAHQSDLYPGVPPWEIEVYSHVISMEIGTSNWVDVTTGIDVDHDLFQVSSSLVDNNTFYAGGWNSSTSFPVIYKTVDGGESWNEVFIADNNQNIATGWSGFNGDHNWWYGEIVFGLDVAPNNPNKLIFTDFGFAHVSDDGGLNWRQAYVDDAYTNQAGSATPQNQSYAGNGLENTSCWQMHWTSEDDMIISYTDISAIRSDDGGEKWSFNYDGINYNSVYHIVKHPTTGTLFAAVSSIHDLYQSTYLTDSQIDGGSGGILYSLDNGDNWNMLHDFNMPVIWLAIDENDPNKMFASVVNSINGGIYKTTDLNNLSTSSWSQTTAPARTEGHPYNIAVLADGTIVSTWCARYDNGFTNSSGVFTSTDDGSSWTDVSMNDEMHYWTKDITIDPNDINQNTWYVAVHSGWGGPANDKGGLYKTTNRGQQWELVFDSHRVESSTVHPTDSSILFVTTHSEGLWYCDNATSQTPIFSQVESYAFQHPTRVFYNPYDVNEIWVTSFGNGMKMGRTDDMNSNVNLEIQHDHITLYPNPTNDVFRLEGDFSNYTIQVTNPAGVIHQELTNEPSPIDIDLSALPNGLYFIKVENSTNTHMSVQQIIKMN